MTVDRRAFVVVLDACGVGALPDAADYGDPGADTLVTVAERTGGLQLPTLQGLGLGNLRDIRGVEPTDAPQALHGRLHPLGPGKDSTTGHWELMGVVPPQPLPTYPDGFPPEVVELIGVPVCANHPSDGMQALEDYGAHHLQTGEVILYTSQDSVLQLAAHVDVLPEDELRALCARVRERLPDAHPIGRVIARPFTGEPGAFVRTTGRKDFSITPPSASHLLAVQAAGVPVHAVGKTADLFAGVGIDERHPGATNATAIAETTRLVEELEGPAFVFTNLIETDQLYGHRKDVEGFKASLEVTDAAVALWLRAMRPGDLLVLTADHGVDPAMPHHDHTREHAPLLAVFDGHGGRRHDGPLSDVGASVVRWLGGDQDPAVPGTPFVA